MSEDVKTRQQDCLKNLQHFSIAIDKSTDTTDTAQLAVFVRGVSSNFDIFEDFVELVLMKGSSYEGHYNRSRYSEGTVAVY